MKVTGFFLKQEIKMANIQVAALTQELASSYSKFDHETDKRTPAEILNEMLSVEEKIARIQTAQAIYNQANMVEYNGAKVPLALVIKLEGVNARLSKLWKDVAKQNEPDRYSRGTLSKDEIYPTSQVNTKGCFGNVKSLATAQCGLQSIIGTSNSKELEIGNVLG